MNTRLPTRHITERGPITGHVYLVVRDRADYAIKIGSTRYPPNQRLSQTKSCTQEAFLIACATTAARELEHYLHLLYMEADKKLPGQDNFDLKAEDILTLAYWFDGGTFRTEQGGDNNTLTLVDNKGYEVRTPTEIGTLLGHAARVAIDAEALRYRAAVREQERRSRSLYNTWCTRVAESWQIEPRQLTGLLTTGQIEEARERAWSYSRKGRHAPIPPKPEWVDSYFEVTPDSLKWADGSDIPWLIAMPDK